MTEILNAAEAAKMSDRTDGEILKQETEKIAEAILAKIKEGKRDLVLHDWIDPRLRAILKEKGYHVGDYGWQNKNGGFLGQEIKW